MDEISDALSGNEPVSDDDVFEEVITGFMDKIDFECELGHCHSGNKVFPTQKDLETHKYCVQSCGIVEVEVRLVRVVRETTRKHG